MPGIPYNPEAGQAHPVAGRRGENASPRRSDRARYKHGGDLQTRRQRTRKEHQSRSTHTRLPRYVRGHVGTIERVIGCHVFPDSNATGAGEDPQWLYTVRFDGRELWGANGDPTVKVSVDAWEPYLESA